jgi:hypothetical protein
MLYLGRERGKGKTFHTHETNNNNERDNREHKRRESENKMIRSTSGLE